MNGPDEREAGFYWISISGQAPGVAQWHTEWGQWLVAGSLQPLKDTLASNVEVLSDMLPPPASTKVLYVNDPKNRGGSTTKIGNCRS